MRNTKYEYTGNVKVVYGVKLKQIRAKKDFGRTTKGDIGGWIQSIKNLSVSGDAWVSGDALVSGDARVSGSARIYGDAWVSGNAWVSGSAWVSGDARVSGSAGVSGKFNKSPLQIQGSRHFVTHSNKGEITIGCYSYSISKWKKEYGEIGKREGYAEAEIKEYGMYINLIARIDKLLDQ